MPHSSNRPAECAIQGSTPTACPMRLNSNARTPARSQTGSSSGAGGNTARSPIAKVTDATSRVPRWVIACWTVWTRPRSPYSDELTAFSTAEASAMSDEISALTACRLTLSSASSSDSLTSDSGWAGMSMFSERSLGSTGMTVLRDATVTASILILRRVSRCGEQRGAHGAVRRRTASRKCGFATFLDPHGGRAPQGGVLGALGSAPADRRQAKEAVRKWKRAPGRPWRPSHFCLGSDCSLTVGRVRSMLPRRVVSVSSAPSCAAPCRCLPREARL